MKGSQRPETRKRPIHADMSLDPDTRAKRVRGARAFAGYEKQPQLGALLKADGFGLHDVGKWERQDPTAPQLSPGRIESLSRHTGLPAIWFTEPDMNRLFGLNQTDTAATRTELARVAEALAKKVDDPDSTELDSIVDELRSTSGETPEEPDEGADV